MKSLRTGLQCIAAAAMALALPNGASAERFEVGIGGGAHFVPMKSMDALTEGKAFGIFSLDAAIALPELDIVPGYSSEVALAWNSGVLDGTSFGRIDSSLALDTIMASARLRRQLLAGRLSTFGSLGLGMQWGELELRDSSSGTSRPLQGKARALATGVGAGVDVQLAGVKSQGHGLQIGLRAEMSYELATSMGFDATPMSQGDDSLPLPTVDASLGSVNASGALVRVGLLGRF